MQRIGVFVCHCGTNIAGTVDTKAVAEALGREQCVVFATDYTYMCSESGQNLIKDTIKNEKLTGVVVCSCSPRMHEATFRKAAASVGLNPYMVEIANIREQCSWIHKDKVEATEKAIILGRAAIAKVLLNTPLTAGESPVVKRALVIGGGIAGIQTALDIAEAGFEVDIVEKKPTIGGKMTQIDKTFPTLDCAACILTPKMVDCAQNEKIKIYSYSEVDSVSGFVGNFTVKIKRKARFVDETKCTGCGLCTEKCPHEERTERIQPRYGQPPCNLYPVRSGSSEGCDYRPRPLQYAQKRQVRRMLQGMFRRRHRLQADRRHSLKKSTALSSSLQALTRLTSQSTANMLTTSRRTLSPPLSLKDLLNAAGPTSGTLLRPSDGKHPHTIVFVQCVGSRCTPERGKQYCSKICCMYTAKHAMLTREKYPDTEVYVFYIDVRTPGKNFDEFYRRAVEDYGVHYIKGAVGKVSPQADGTLDVQASDLIMNEQLHIKADLVVLAAAIEPDKSARPLATKLTASMDTNDFFTEAHPKLRPVESPTAGIFLSGVCQGPKDIPETVSQASACAAKVIGLLVKDKLTCNPCVAHSNEMMCNGCSQCANVCPYGAITYVEKEFRMPDRTTKVRRVASVNPAVCQGCGACTVTCPSGAMDLFGFSNNQIMAEVDAICK